MILNEITNGNKPKKSLKKGFTLIELLISIMLFTVFLGIVSQSYLGIVRSQRQANEVRKMYSELRVFMDDFAEDVRLSAIDYDCYEQGIATIMVQALCNAEATGQIVGGKTQVLSLVKKGGGEKVTYKIEKDGQTGDRRIKVKKWYKDFSTNNWNTIPGYEEFRDVFSERIDVKYAYFAIFPEVNPYSSLNYRNNAVQFQPKVTLLLNVGNAEDSKIKFDYQFQTSISSRVYTRAI